MSEESTETIPAAPAEPGEVDTAAAVTQLRGQQNFGLAVLAGLAAALVGAVVWALFAYATGMELGLIVIAIGALIGFVIRKVGRGVDPAFGILGAACAAISWALGTILSDVAFLAKQAGTPFLDVLTGLGVSASISFAISHADVMDFVFLAIALWEGYKFSYHRFRA